jgi:hypothetical protein
VVNCSEQFRKLQLRILVDHDAPAAAANLIIGRQNGDDGEIGPVTERKGAHLNLAAPLSAQKGSGGRSSDTDLSAASSTDPKLKVTGPVLRPCGRSRPLDPPLPSLILSTKMISEGLFLLIMGAPLSTSRPVRQPNLVRRGGEAARGKYVPLHPDRFRWTDPLALSSMHSFGFQLTVCRHLSVLSRLSWVMVRDSSTRCPGPRTPALFLGPHHRVVDRALERPAVQDVAIDAGSMSARPPTSDKLTHGKEYRQAVVPRTYALQPVERTQNNALISSTIPIPEAK